MEDSATEERAPTPVPDRAARTAERLTHGNLFTGVLRFGLPLVVGMILYTAFNLVDMFMISRLPGSTAALGALGICDMVSTGATILANGVATAAVALISRRVGASDLRGVRRAAYQSLLLIAAMSVAFGLAGIFGSDFIVRVVMQAKGDAADIAVSYLEIILGGCFSMFFLLQLTSIIRALGHSKTAASLLIGGNVLNVVLNIFLIYGDGPHPAIFAWAAPMSQALGMPRLEVDGAAWATVIGRSVPAVIGAVLVVRWLGGRSVRLPDWKPNWSELRKLITVGWPSSAQMVVRVVAVLVFISLINANYTTLADQSTLSAYSICLRLETMALFVGLGWGAAASSFVGMNLGAGQPVRAKNAGWVAALYNFGLMLALLWLYTAEAEAIVGFFDESPQVLAIGREYLQIVGLSYGFIGVGIVLSQAMTGAGATFSSMVIDSGILILVVVPAAYLITETYDLSRFWLWIVIAGGNVAGCLAFLGFYAKGGFLRKQLL
jgi:putative MATE family efflux protein